MKELLVDTNLLVLLFVGAVDERAIARHRRTTTYDVAAFRLLATIVRQAQSIIVTPHVLTETSNLIRQCGEPLAGRLGAGLAVFVSQATERVSASLDLVRDAQHLRLGLTDTAVLDAQTRGAVLLTDDNGLYLASLAAGHAAINFAHLRDR